MAEVCHGPEQGSLGRGEVVAIDGTQFSLENVRREVLSVRTCWSKASLGRYTPKDNALNTVLFLLEQGSVRVQLENTL